MNKRIRKKKAKQKQLALALEAIKYFPVILENFCKNLEKAFALQGKQQ